MDPDTIEKNQYSATEVAKALIAAIERAMDEGYTAPVSRLQREIAGRWGESTEDVLLKALTLYKAALEAEDAGHHLAVIGPDDEIIRDITEVKPERRSEPAGA